MNLIDDKILKGMEFLVKERSQINDVKGAFSLYERFLPWAYQQMARKIAEDMNSKNPYLKQLIETFDLKLE